MADASGAPGARVGALFSDHGRMVYGLCRMLLRDPIEAEDAAQETFLSAYRALLRGGGPRDPAAWLAAIARNECRTRLRARSREPVTVVREPHSGLAEGPDALVERRLWADELARALGELTQHQREAVVLRDLYGLRTREVGAALGLSRPAVESLVFRARRRLRVRLRPAAGALVLPLALREGLAQALPGFSSGAAGAAGATGAVVSGTALVAKLAAGTAAVGTATSVVLVGSERPVPPSSHPRPVAAAPAATPPPAPAPATAPVRAAAVPASAVERRDEPRRAPSGSNGPGSNRGDDDRDERDREDRDEPDVDDEHEGDSAAHDGSGRSGPDRRGDDAGEVEDEESERSGPSEDEDDDDSSGPGGGESGRGSGSSD
jgi:RNA polymerase sigma factor (sigma-70 family)